MKFWTRQLVTPLPVQTKGRYMKNLFLSVIALSSSSVFAQVESNLELRGTSLESKTMESVKIAFRQGYEKPCDLSSTYLSNLLFVERAAPRARGLFGNEIGYKQNGIEITTSDWGQYDNVSIYENERQVLNKIVVSPKEGKFVIEEFCKIVNSRK
jgi:hypothetical protein